MLLSCLAAIQFRTEQHKASIVPVFYLSLHSEKGYFELNSKVKVKAIVEKQAGAPIFASFKEEFSPRSTAFLL